MASTPEFGRVRRDEAAYRSPTSYVLHHGVYFYTLTPWR